MSSRVPVLTIVFLLAGFAGGRLWHHAAAASAPDAGNTRVPSRSGSMPSALATVLPADQHGYAALRARMGRIVTAGPSVSRELERLDATALKELVAVALTDPRADSDDSTESGAVEDTFLLACGELYRREGTKALDWAESVGEAAGRQRVLRELLILAAGESPELAKPWMDRYGATYGETERGYLLGPRLISAAEQRGANAVIRLGEILGEDCWASGSGRGYPEGFDFAMLVTGLPDCGGRSDAVEGWAARDREAAWAGVMAFWNKDGAGENADTYLRGLYQGAAFAAGDEAAARWIGEKLDSLQEGKDGKMLANISEEIPAAQDATFLAALKQDADKLAYAGGLTEVPYAPDWQRLHGVFAALGTEALQGELLTRTASELAAGWHGEPEGHSSTEGMWTPELLQEQMDLLEFSPGARAKVMAAWQAASADRDAREAAELRRVEEATEEEPGKPGEEE